MRRCPTELGVTSQILPSHISRMGPRSMHILTRASSTLALIALTAACRLEYAPPASDTSSARTVNDSAADAAGVQTGEELTSFARDRHFDFTGDGDPEEIKVRARGERSDALTVTLRIEDPTDSVLYFDTWRSDAYLKYTDARTRADRRAVRGIVQSQLEKLLTSSNIGSQVADRLRNAVDTSLDSRASVVQRDVAEAIFRQRRDIPRDSIIATSDYDSLEALVRARPDRSRAQRALADVNATDRYYMYFRGGEETLAIAWSPREKRFVKFWTCC
jgi:hypothetical protein